MPFKSKAQQRWAHTPTGESALGGPGAVSEWDSASKGMNLPNFAAGSKSKTFKGMPSVGHPFGKRGAKKPGGGGGGPFGRP